jgi:predicted RNA methylase
MIVRAKREQPERVVDPGAGQGDFSSRQVAHSESELLAVEADPLAALLCRAHVAAAGLGRRARVSPETTEP